MTRTCCLINIDFHTKYLVATKYYRQKISGYTIFKVSQKNKDDPKEQSNHQNQTKL